MITVVVPLLFLSHFVAFCLLIGFTLFKVFQQGCKVAKMKKKKQKKQKIRVGWLRRTQTQQRPFNYRPEAISFLISSEFKQLNFYSSRNHYITFGFLMTLGWIEVN